MELNETINCFCKEYGYKGHIKYRKTGTYHIVISKDGDNAGAFLSEDEYRELDTERLQEILTFLDRGFKEKFNKDEIKVILDESATIPEEDSHLY